MSKEISQKFQENTVGKQFYCYPFYFQALNRSPPHSVIILILDKDGDKHIVDETGLVMEDIIADDFSDEEVQVE